MLLELFAAFDSRSQDPFTQSRKLDWDQRHSSELSHRIWAWTLIFRHKSYYVGPDVAMKCMHVCLVTYYGAYGQFQKSSSSSCRRGSAETFLHDKVFSVFCLCDILRSAWGNSSNLVKKNPPLPGFLQVTDWFKQVSNETAVSEETFMSSDVYGTF